MKIFSIDARYVDRNAAPIGLRVTLGLNTTDSLDVEIQMGKDSDLAHAYRALEAIVVRQAVERIGDAPLGPG